MVTEQINDRLGPGGLSSVAVFSENASGNVTGLVGAGGQTIQLLGRGSNIVAVSSVAEIVQAIADLTPLTTRFAQTAVITATNGSATVTGVSTGWSTGNPVGVGDLWKPDAGSRYYKVKFVVSDTELTLWEPYQGATITATSTAFTFYYLNRYSIMVAPGEYAVTGTEPIILQPGFDFVALDPHSTVFSEGQSTPASPFSNLGDNNFTNIRWAPTSRFGAMDGMFGAAGFAAVKPDLWAGASAKFTGCIVHSGNARDVHAGGSTRMPVLAGGLTIFEACEFLQDHSATFDIGGGITASNANTRVVMNGCVHRKYPGSDTKAANLLLYQSLLSIVDLGGGLLGTFDIHNPQMITEDFAINPSLGNVGGIAVYVAANVNIRHGSIDVANTSGAEISCGVDVQAAGATVNISQSSIDASGTGAVGLNIGAVAATVNVQAGTRIKGSTNSINAGAGSTVNVSGNADLIGATTGAGTINLATAT